MRIGVVCPYDLAAAGGVQQICIDLRDRLTEAGEDVVLIAAGSPNRSSTDSGSGTIGAGGVIRVPANGSTVPLTVSPPSWRRVRQALSNVDVAHVHEPLIPLVGWAALATGVPMVTTFHADPPLWVARLYGRAPYITPSLRRTVMTAVSPVAARTLPERWGEVTIVPNAIDVAAFDRPVQRNPFQVVFLGRDDPRKGLDLLLRAWPRVRQAVPDAELIVAGATRHQVLDGVTFLGTVTGPVKHDILAASGIYVAPNTGGESFGMVIAEAMAAGCAVVASDLPAFEAVLAGTGRLVPVGDHAALASALVSLLNQTGRVEAMGRAARSAVRRFDWPVVLDAYRGLYRRAVGI